MAARQRSHFVDIIVIKIKLVVIDDDVCRVSIDSYHHDHINLDVDNDFICWDDVKIIMETLYINWLSIIKRVYLTFIIDFTNVRDILIVVVVTHHMTMMIKTYSHNATKISPSL